ncbi:MAG: hypothetical protein J5693_03860, partial [Bacteroidales bacterium]|nr:hypothetical protein [Bacteroidales bacterium]
MKRLIINILLTVIVSLAYCLPSRAANILPHRDTIVVRGPEADTVFVVTDSICPAPSIRVNLAYLAT